MASRRFELPDLVEWRRAAPNFVRRQVKTLRQTRHGWGHARRLGFVFGCQRSGTKMVMRVLDEADETRVFHENHSVAFEDFQLRSDRVLRALIGLTPAPVQLFKPICDSHRAADVLARFPQARGAWVARRADDVASSAVKKWGGHQRDVVEAVLAGDLDRFGWRTAGLSDAMRAELSEVARGERLTAQEGALLFWWMRNQTFFSQGLDRTPRMRLVLYSELVTTPVEAFAPLFHHLGAAWSPRFVRQVRSSSLGRAPAPVARPAIRAICDDLEQRFLDWKPVPLPVPSPVLLIIDTLGRGGAERYVVTVANRLAALGSEVTVVHGGGELDQELVDGIEVVKGGFNAVRARLPLASLELRAVLKRCEPVAIVANSLATAILSRTAQTTRRIPVVQVGHGWPSERFAVVAPRMRVSDRVVAVSPDVKARLVAAGLDEERVSVVYNGVDVSPFQRLASPEDRARVRAEIGVPADAMVVIVVGRLVDQKRHEHLFGIARRLRDRVPGLCIVVVGWGERADELESLNKAEGTSDLVRFLGIRRDVPELLSAADIFLNCSDWEGMPLSTIEGMCAGLPIVATRTEGADQLLTPETGIVAEVGDVDGLAAGVARLAADPDLLRGMGERAQVRAHARFSHERMVDQLLEVVHTVARP